MVLLRLGLLCPRLLLSAARCVSGLLGLRRLRGAAGSLALVVGRGQGRLAQVIALVLCPAFGTVHACGPVNDAGSRLCLMAAAEP